MCPPHPFSSTLLFFGGSYNESLKVKFFVINSIHFSSSHFSFTSQFELFYSLLSLKVIEVSASSESVQSPALNPRKRFHSAEEVQCGSRPNPEGAGSVSVTELNYSENKDGRESLCQRCQIIAKQLNRQARELAEPGTLKVCTFN